MYNYPHPAALPGTQAIIAQYVWRFHTVQLCRGAQLFCAPFGLQSSLCGWCGVKQCNVYLGKDKTVVILEDPVILVNMQWKLVQQ